MCFCCITNYPKPSGVNNDSSIMLRDFQDLRRGTVGGDRSLLCLGNSASKTPIAGGWNLLEVSSLTHLALKLGWLKSWAQYIVTWAFYSLASGFQKEESWEKAFPKAKEKRTWLYDLASEGTNCPFYCTLLVRAAQVHPDFREGDVDHTLWWEEYQRICNHLFLEITHHW